MIRHVVYYFILLIITSIFSVVNSLYERPVNFINIVGTTLFLLGLSLYSYYQGLQKNNNYRKFIIRYGVLIVITTILAIISNLSILGLILYVNMIPVYSMKYLLGILLNADVAIITIIILESTIIYLCYRVGKGERITKENGFEKINKYFK